MSRSGRAFGILALGVAAVTGCGRSGAADSAGRSGSRESASGKLALKGSSPSRVNIYAFTGADALSPVAKRARPLVYVPNSRSNSVSVIDPATYAVIRTFPTRALPQHVVPAFDLDTLWVANNNGNSLTPIDPATGQEGEPVHVDDPYNLYFTPDGKSAMVIAERRQRFDFRDPHTMKLQQSLPVKCRGLDHVEFTADGRFAIATCEFTGELVKIDVDAHQEVGYLLLDPDHLKHHSMPQDIRSSADGSTFFAADMKAGGVWVIDPVAFRQVGFIPTGIGAHGIYPSRDGRYLYVTNRGWKTTAGGRHGPGSVSVLDPVARKVVATWPVPHGGSPDMGDVTADGKELWVSGRYDSEVYVFDTTSGEMTHRIPVGREPHGLCVWPQPGRYSLGHTGNMR